MNSQRTKPRVAMKSNPTIAIEGSVSPISPDCPPAEKHFKYQMTKVKQSMIQKGYIPVQKLTITLQGSVWIVKSENNENYIIKITNKDLHYKSVACIDGKEIKVSEDIIKESSILRYLTEHDPPNELAKFIDFFEDNSNYFLVMEHGGTSFFDFVQSAHVMIEEGTLSIKEWQRFSKLALKQIVAAINWLHKKMHCAHLDLSLENFVISDVLVKIDERHHKVSFLDKFQIKIIDFGLAEMFTNKDKLQCGPIDYRCTKFVGKTLYKSPKVYGKKEIFHALYADCWSFGVLLFLMVVGVQPYTRPCKKDKAFQYIWNDQLLELLYEYKRTSYLTPEIYDLMSRILKPEKRRLNMDGIMKHPWFTY